MKAPGLRLTTWILTILHNAPIFEWFIWLLVKCVYFDWPGVTHQHDRLHCGTLILHNIQQTHPFQPRRMEISLQGRCGNLPTHSEGLSWGCAQTTCHSGYFVCGRSMTPARSRDQINRGRHLKTIALCTTPTPYLKVMLQNTRSICNKVSVVAETIIDADADVSFLTETWLRSYHQDIVNDLTLPGFELKHLKLTDLANEVEVCVSYTETPSSVYALRPWRQHISNYCNCRAASHVITLP